MLRALGVNQLQQQQSLENGEIGQGAGGFDPAAGPLALLGLALQFLCARREKVQIHAAHGDFIAHGNGFLILNFFPVDGDAAFAAQGIDGPQAVLVPLYGGVLPGHSGKIQHNITGARPANDIFPVVQGQLCAVGQAEKTPGFLFRPPAQQGGSAAHKNQQRHHGGQHMKGQQAHGAQRFQSAAGNGQGKAGEECAQGGDPLLYRLQNRIQKRHLYLEDQKIGVE